MRQNELQAAIAKRKQDTSWNLAIAKKIVKRKRKQKHIVYTASSLAFALLFFTVFFLKPLFINTETRKMNLNNAITAQVQGVYNTVFEKKHKDSAANNVKTINSILADDSDIDDVIDRALTERL